MDRILVILHQERSRTRRVGRVLRQMGYTLDIRRPCRGDALPLTMDEHAAAVIFGGPMGVYECEKHPFLRDELDWISLALESGKPFLGICLGCQMLAHVLGGRVWRHPDGLHEVGYYPVLPTAEGADIFESTAMPLRCRGVVPCWPAAAKPLKTKCFNTGPTHLASSSIPS